MTESRSALPALRRNLGLSAAAVLAGGGTLLCCVLPALMVALGAGAALASLVSAVPALVWLSLHKTAVFALALMLLSVAGVVLWRARRLPCPADPALAAHCSLLRRASLVLWLLALLCVAVGALFAFALPLLT
jgi:hypothetical protein